MVAKKEWVNIDKFPWWAWVVIVIGTIVVVVIAKYIMAWTGFNLWTGLNVECHDLFCQMRRG